MSFDVRHAGIDSALRIVIFMDDVDSPDLAVFGDETLIKKIDGEIKRFRLRSGERVGCAARDQRGRTTQAA